MPLQEVANLKKSDLDSCSSAAHTAANAADTEPKAPILRAPLADTPKRKKYLFPLRARSGRHIAQIVNALFRRARLPQATDPFQTVEALWAYAALRTGIPASALLSHLGHVPLGLPVLKLCKSSVISHQSSDVCPPLSDLKDLKDVKDLKDLSPRATQDAAFAADLASDKSDSIEQVGDLQIMPKPLASAWGNPANSGVASERRFVVETSQDAALPAESNPSANTAQSADTASTARRYCGSAADTFKEYFASVGKIFLENPPRWYAMSLRPGVRFTQVCRRIQQLHSSLLTLDSSPKAVGLQLFYPCEEIARAIGKKIVVRQRPFIHSVVFFRAKLTDIGRLFAKIGDLAWCYRQNARPGAPYADISERQFQLFQQTIARFTPDYEVAPSGELPLHPNDRVQILGGLFTGHTATFVEESRTKSQAPSIKTAASRLKTEDSAQPAEPNIVYRLNIIGDNGIDWRITLDPRLAKPADT